MQSIFSRFDRIQIVNLKRRTDRRRQMERELRRVGLSVGDRVAFFEALQFDNPGPFARVGSNGAYHSHLAILKEAAANGESVLILQDDCDFLPVAMDYELPEGGDIFYGGYYASDPKDLHNSEIIGAHFMGFSREAASKAAAYLEALLDPDFPPDEKAAAVPGFDPAIRPPVDGALVWFRRAHPELRTEFAMLGVQRPSRTEIGDLALLDRIWGIKHLATWARSARYAVRRYLG